MLLGGEGISQYEAGEIRFYLDETLQIPLSIIEHSRLNDVDLSNYSHLILVDGDYTKVSGENTSKLKVWITQGGVVFGQKRGAKWLAEQQILSVDFVSKKQIAQLFDSEKLSYKDKTKLSARKRIAGAILPLNLIHHTHWPLVITIQRCLYFVIAP
jgi:hypothetical protein